jgi:trans-2,3-dihydro-3-hydroxyanthranilate isomerase
MQLPFHTLDVFTDRTFGGNPLGVFPDAAHLPTDLMQRIALEMHLSETVFLGPPETSEGSARVRIFTPRREVPFAGHPTVGTAIFLAADVEPGGSGSRTSGRADPAADSVAANSVTLILEENVGPVSVAVRLENGTPVFAQFTTAMLPEHRPSPHSSNALASMVGLDAADVCPDAMSVEMVSCGLEYHIIPVRTIDAILRAVLDMALWRQMVADSWAHHVYLVCPQAEGEDVDVRVRMFAPGSGVPEDPATGSAAAALGGYLSKIDGRPEASLSWTVEQGLEMGRPSIIHVEADRADGDTKAVRVGGSAVFVSRGTMTIQE